MSYGSPEKGWLRIIPEVNKTTANRLDELFENTKPTPRERREADCQRLFWTLDHVWSGHGGLAHQALVVSKLGRALKKRGGRLV